MNDYLGDFTYMLIGLLAGMALGPLFDWCLQQPKGDDEESV